MMKTFRRFIRDRSGATSIEYALIAALIFLALLVSVGNSGNSLQNLYNTTFTTIATTLAGS